jgi:hypothetical protein
MENSMSNKGLYQTGFVFAILTTLSWLVFVVGSITSGDGSSLEGWLALGNSTAGFLYNWGGTFGSLLAIPVFLALYTGFRQEIGVVLRIPVAFALVGSAYLAMGFMVDAGSGIYIFRPIVAEASGDEAIDLWRAARLAQDSIEVTWFIGSFMAYGAAVVWMAVLMLRSAKAPRWLNWVGIIAGLAGFIWLRLFIPIPMPQILFLVLILINVFVGMGWMVGLTFILARANED